jgi:hypothetical protein
MGCHKQETQFSCARSNWLYTGASSNSFTKLQWTSSNALSLAWRALFFAWWSVNFIRGYIVDYPVSSLGNKIFPLAYLTRWGELFCLTYSLVSFLVVGYAVIRKRGKNDEEANGWEKFSGFLAETSVSVALMITILYYGKVGEQVKSFPGFRLSVFVKKICFS